MTPPAALVRTARELWRLQWRILMGGLGPADRQGRYQRPQGAFTDPPPVPEGDDLAAGHVLIVGRSCPWAHRAWLTWTLRRLQPGITLLVVEPDPAAGRWRFAEPFEGCHTLIELYRRSGADRRARATVPALWSPGRQRILINESARLIELLNRWPAPPDAPDLAPPGQRQAIEQWRERLQGDVNDGVYRCGFARNQAAYDEAVAALFGTLEAVDRELMEQQRLGRQWLCGDSPSLADVVLFPTLIRLEMVYAPLFGCSQRPLWRFPHLWQWRRRFYQLRGVAATCHPGAWRTDYFGALFPLHPSGIVPAGPDQATLVGEEQPHPCPSPPPQPPSQRQ
jgi:putative glutathione S-transferase